MAGGSSSVPRSRVNAFAQMLSEGMRQKDIGAALGLTKGEASNCFRVIKRELGAQAV